MADLFQRLQESLADRYRIERELGSGGMAIVYLAQDLKHERHVAVKVLQPELAAVIGGDRFLREIRIAANLNHPHILPLHDSGQANGFLYYVMPYVEGESLRNRLDRETQLPIEEAIRITQQAASALEAAHGQGIIHRDIKPENILLQKGEVLVADFGIALAVRVAGGQRLTESGLSLGTPQYMSPEQASADRQIDARSDVYSLGSVLYEMLVGEPPFTGPNVQAIIAKLLSERAPGVRGARDTVSPAVEHTVMKALEKLPADRFATAQEFADTLVRVSTSGVAFSRAASPSRETRGVWSWRSATAVLMLSLVMVLWSPWRSDQPRPSTLAAFSIAMPTGLTLDQSGFGSPVAISRDGSKAAFVAQHDGETEIYLRPIDDVEPTLLAGTEGATAPFFSPDGDWVAFFAGGFLKRVSLLGGAPQIICEAPGPRSGVWEDEGTIIMGSAGNIERFLASANPDWQFTPDQGVLERVTVSGGVREEFSMPESTMFTQGILQTEHWPQLLPNGKGVLYTLFNGPGWEPGSMQIAVFSFETGERKVLIESGASPTYLETGHILYAWQGELLVVPFDPENIEVTGSPVALVVDAAMTVIGSAFYSISAGGTLVYVSGEVEQVGRRLVLVDRRGSAEAIPIKPGFYLSPRVSPDGSRFVVGDYRSLWSYDLERGTFDRVTDDAGTEFWAVWHPTGESLFFNSNRHGEPLISLYLKSVDGDDMVRISTGNVHHVPQTVSPDGRALLLTQVTDSATGFDVFRLAVGQDMTPQPWIDSPYDETVPAFSPDGAWVAYTSTRSGQAQVYVRPFPGPGNPTRVSIEGGREPLWDPTGRTIFFRDLSGDSVMAVPFSPDPLHVGSPALLFAGGFAKGDIWGRNYDIMPDGNRFLMISDGGPEQARDFRILLDWFEELKRLVRVPDN